MRANETTHLELGKCELNQYFNLVLEPTKLLLVNDTAANIHIRGYRVVVIPKGSSFRDVADNIHRGIVRVANYSHITFMIGRAEVLA